MYQYQFIDLQDQLNVSGKLLPIFRSARLRFFTAYGIVSCRCGRQGFGERQRGTTCTIWRKLLDWVKSQSCAPEDGQKFARNMLSWSWRSINCYCCICLVFYITLPTLMMHGQTQIKYQERFWQWSISIFIAVLWEETRGRAHLLRELQIRCMHRYYYLMPLSEHLHCCLCYVK